MNIWDDKGNARCHCGSTWPAAATRDVTVQMLRARGWHHSAGKTLGGDDYEALLCPTCVKGEKKRRTTPSGSGLDQDALPINWDPYQSKVKGEQQHQR